MGLESIAKMGALTAAAAVLVMPVVASFAQSYSVPASLQAKIDSRPHVRKLTDWGSRPDWSPDSKKVVFASREYGDVFELEIATGKTRPLTFHYSHEGVLRAYYLPNGDLLLLAPKEHVAGLDDWTRKHEAEMWLLKGDLSRPAIPLGVRNKEGVAVSRNSPRIAWAKSAKPAPARPARGSPAPESDADMAGEIWISDIVEAGGKAELRNQRKVLDCAETTGPLAEYNASRGAKCIMIEPQNFVPTDDNRLTFSMATASGKRGKLGAYTIDLRTNKITMLENGQAYAEPEGVFPDGKFTLVEYTPATDMRGALSRIDLWRLALDGSGKMRRVTKYNELDPSLKSNQGVVSPAGRWMIFGVSTAEIEKKVTGQGIGLFMMDLKAGGF